MPLQVRGFIVLSTVPIVSALGHAGTVSSLCSAVGKTLDTTMGLCGVVFDSSVAFVMPTRRPRGGSLSKSAAKAEVGGDGGDLKKEGKWERV